MDCKNLSLTCSRGALSHVVSMHEQGINLVLRRPKESHRSLRRNRGNLSEVFFLDHLKVRGPQLSTACLIHIS